MAKSLKVSECLVLNTKQDISITSPPRPRQHQRKVVKTRLSGPEDWEESQNAVFCLRGYYIMNTQQPWLPAQDLPLSPLLKEDMKVGRGLAGKGIGVSKSRNG